MTTILDPSVRPLNRCGCCSGLGMATPAVVDNRPGLTAVAYRSGTWHEFKSSLLAALSSPEHQALAGLATRADDDFTVAFLDAVAVVADVLTFYGERIANESYLRTATERLSILELARLIGYQLRPGTAASTLLAFEVEAARDVLDPPPVATIDVGVKVQSVPGQDEKPQTFETIEKIAVSAEWNEMKPLTTAPQYVTLDATELWVEGTATDLRTGDVVLVVDPSRATKARMAAEAASGRIGVLLARATDPGLTPIAQQATSFPGIRRANLGWETAARAFNYEAPFDVRRVVRVEPDFDARRTRVVLGSSLGQTGPFLDETASLDIYALRTSAAVFGANAADWNAMSLDFKGAYPGGANSGDWPGFDQVFNETVGSIRSLDLDSVHPGILPGSWAVLASPDSVELFWVRQALTTGRAQFGLGGKVTRLDLWGGAFGVFDDERRETTVYAQAERLTPVRIPIEPPLTDLSNTITLDRTITAPPKGRACLLSGEDETGARVVEGVVLDSVTSMGSLSQLVFTSTLEHRYCLDTLSINANVAQATHGETVAEVLGGGDASRPYQHFKLKQQPLTFTRDPLAPSGTTSTLRVRVNDLEWEEAPSFYSRQPQQRVFVSHTDDEGRTSVEFGDGVRGARLPSGQENVRAIYRKGTGVGGNVRARQLSTLLTRPLNLKSATNPLPATGGADDEASDDARENAPLTVLTLDRVVSLRDYEDFARAYAGIAKALATWTWDGQRRGIFITVAGPKGTPVADDDIELLIGAVRATGDPFVPLRVASYRKATFTSSFKLKIEPAYERTKVSADVVATLRAGFGFPARAFGQAVALSDVIATIQAVEGVAAVDVDSLERTGAGGVAGHFGPVRPLRVGVLSLQRALSPGLLAAIRTGTAARIPRSLTLPAGLPEIDPLGSALPAELLTLAEDPITPGEMT